MTDTTRHMDRAVPTSGFGMQRDDARSEREFARARRHSRLVAALKFGLPLIAVAIVAGGIAVTWLARSLPDNVSVSSASIDNGRVVMEDPRMTGTDQNQRPYSLIAQRAIQSLDGGGIDLEQVRASISVDADSTADVVAARGHYDQTGQKLRLYDDISVDTTNGMSMTLSEAQIDLTTSSMVGSGPVQIKTPSQDIAAGSLSVTDGGKILTFGQGVKMTLTPSSPPASAPSVAGREQARSESN